MHMITILHLSDLYLYKDAQTYNMQEILIKEAKEAFKNIPKGQKLLIITGDYHNYTDIDYNLAETFLSQLITAMGIDCSQDVFMVPGNHDIGNKDTLKSQDINVDPEDISAYTLKIQSGSMERYIEKKLKAYFPYCDFVRRLGLYNDSSDLLYPARVHVRQWQGKNTKLNILHLNTTLAANAPFDETNQISLSNKNNQMTDLTRVFDPETWKSFDTPDLPCIALGHDHFYNLAEAHQTSLQSAFSSKNVSAYLCGDSHRTEDHARNQMIPLSTGPKQDRLEIPNLVCAKNIGDMEDDYSDFGYYLHEWNEDTGEVKVIFRRWKPEYIAQSFHDESIDGVYYMRSSPAISHTKPQTNTASNIQTNKENIADYLQKVVYSIGISANDYKNSKRIIMWPVVPRKYLNAIHFAQLELIRILSSQCHWRVQCLITETSLDPIRMSSEDVNKFVHHIDAFCQKNKIDIDFICLNKTITHMDNFGKKKNRNEEKTRINESASAFYAEMFNLFNIVQINTLTTINEKKYDDSVKDEMKGDKVLTYLVPLLQLAALKTLYNITKVKYVVVAGNDECLQWKIFSEDWGYNYISAILIPEINTKDGKNICQRDEDNKEGVKKEGSPLNCYDRETVLEFKDIGNVSEWYYKMFYCLPTQREVKVKKKKRNTAKEWDEIFIHIAQLIQQIS